MGYTLDFKAIKALATLHDIAAWLGLVVKNDRCQCPRNEGDVRELVLNADRQSWTCFGCKKNYPNDRNSGDSIQLVAHCLQVDQKEAAAHISKRFHGYSPDKRGLPQEGFELDYTHDRVKALGLSPERAEEYGIGFRDKGTTRKALLIAMRDTKGKLHGYLIQNEDGTLRLPKNMQDL